MPSDYRIFAGGTTIYLHNSSGTPTSGGAATAAATTPWVLRSPDWTPRASFPDTIFSGGPPFRTGSTPVSAAYPNVTETIPLILDGGTHNTLVARLQQLRQLTSSALAFAPAALYVLPNGATTAVYFEILAAYVQERATESGESPGEGATLIHVDLTITRSAHGSGTGVTNLFTQTTFTNNGTNNLTSLGSLTGDLTYEGSPLNVTLDAPNAGSTDVGTLWLSVCGSRIKTTHTVASGSVTSSLVFLTYPASPAIDLSALYGDRGQKVYVFVRCSSVTAGNKAQFQCGMVTYNSGVVLGTTPWQAMPVTTGATMLYCGAFDLASLRAFSGGGTIGMALSFAIRSTDGTAVACTVDYSEVVLGYSLLQIPVATTLGSGIGVSVQGIQASADSGVRLALYPPRAFTVNLSVSSPSTTISPLAARGTYPQAFVGASLYASWIKAAGTHTTTDATRITVEHSPQYKTLRGNG